MPNVDTIIQEWKRAGLAVRDVPFTVAERDVSFFPTDKIIDGAEVLVYTGIDGEFHWYVVADLARYQNDGDYLGDEDPSDVVIWQHVQRYTRKALTI